MPGDHVPSVPINKPSFDWFSINLSQEFATFKKQVLSLLEDGPYSKLEAKQKVATLLNWLGPDAYKLYNDELDFTGKDKNGLRDVIDVFENHFKPQQIMIHAWYRIGSLFSIAVNHRHNLCTILKS